LHIFSPHIIFTNRVEQNGGMESITQKQQVSLLSIFFILNYIKLDDLLKLTFCARHITVTSKNKRLEYFNL